MGHGDRLQDAVARAVHVSFVVRFCICGWKGGGEGVFELYFPVGRRQQLGMGDNTYFGLCKRRSKVSGVRFASTTERTGLKTNAGGEELWGMVECCASIRQSKGQSKGQHA